MRPIVPSSRSVHIYLYLRSYLFLIIHMDLYLLSRMQSPMHFLWLEISHWHSVFLNHLPRGQLIFFLLLCQLFLFLCQLIFFIMSTYFSLMSTYFFIMSIFLLCQLFIAVQLGGNPDEMIWVQNWALDLRPSGVMD